MAMKNALKQPEKNAQSDPGEKGWACYYCGKEGHPKRDCPQASKPPPAPCPDCLESPTPETYASGGSLSSSVVLCRPDMELGAA